MSLLRNGKRRVVVAVAAAALTAGGLAVAPLAAAVAPTAERGGAGATDRTDLDEWLAARGDDRIQRLAGSVDALAAHLGADRFGGSRWTANGELVVQVVGGTAAAAVVRTWRSTVDDPGLVVHVEHVRHSRASLKALAEHLPAQVSKGTGIDAVHAAWVDTTRNAVVLTVVDTAAADVSALTGSRYGDAVSVRATGAMHTTANRRQASSPFYGALSINNYSTTNPGHPSDCTSGYAWRLWSTGAVVESTAGHCWARGTAVYNATSRVGTVTHRAYTDGGPTDAEFITPPSGTMFAARIWVGSTSTTVSWPVVGAIEETDAHVGGPIVISGSNGGETRGTLLDVNAKACFDPGTPRYHCTNGLTLFSVDSGGIQGGDSGGPCFTSATGAPGTVVARGQVVGSNDPGPGQIGACTPVTDISAALGATILTQ